MKKISIYQIDAFAERQFEGNPAAVCPLSNWIGKETMQAIAEENNLAETAFFVPRKDYFEIRWFTPTTEVDLCGHATLASAAVIFDQLNYKESVIKFHTQNSGNLSVSKEQDILYLDFPADNIAKSDVYQKMQNILGIKPEDVYKGKTDYMVILKSETDVHNLIPDFQAIASLDARGLIVCAKGDHSDFVSRFFAPQSGVNEDPVTGSAHTSLIPYWSKKLQKEKLSARQISSRGGVLKCEHLGTRVRIGGKTRLYMAGEIYI